MEIAVGIPLIIIGFLVPIVLYLIYRRYMQKKARDRVTNGEIFDKEGERLGLVEDGTQYSLSKKKTQSL